jgi:hypothetical protein
VTGREVWSEHGSFCVHPNTDLLFYECMYVCMYLFIVEVIEVELSASHFGRQMLYHSGHTPSLGLVFYRAPWVIAVCSLGCEQLAQSIHHSNVCGP